MGHAMEVLLGSRHELSIWEKFPRPGFKSADLEEVLPHADFVLFCLPVNPHREILGLIKGGLKPHSLCLSIAKGLDETGSTAAQIFEETLALESFALLYGPMISEEIQQNGPAFAQVGYHHPQVFGKICDLFQGSTLYLKPSSDVSGISWSVILKNVYAIVFGIADELEFGKNTRGYLAVAALNELNSIVGLMGGEQGSPFDLAGLGDLVTTATSLDSHHHNLGQKLARGETGMIKGEGIHTLDMIKKYQLVDTGNFPLMAFIESVVQRPGEVERRFRDYLDRAFMQEGIQV